MQALLESIDRYIEQKIEAVLGDRRFFNHADVVGFIDQRIESALQNFKPFKSEDLAEALTTHLGGDGDTILRGIAEELSEAREFKMMALGVIQRHCRSELKEVVEEGLGQMLTDHFEDEPQALQQAVENFMVDNEDAVEIVRKAMSGFTLTLNN